MNPHPLAHLWCESSTNHKWIPPFQFGGICGFLQTSLAEAQAVVGAHTASQGGNALMSYHLSEVIVLRTASRNQAQCLLNVCGDMAKLVPAKPFK